MSDEEKALEQITCANMRSLFFGDRIEAVASARAMANQMWDGGGLADTAVVDIWLFIERCVRPLTSKLSDERLWQFCRVYDDLSTGFMTRWRVFLLCASTNQSSLLKAVYRHRFLAKSDLFVNWSAELAVLALRWQAGKSAGVPVKNGGTATYVRWSNTKTRIFSLDWNEPDAPLWDAMKPHRLVPLFRRPFFFDASFGFLAKQLSDGQFAVCFVDASLVLLWCAQGQVQHGRLEKDGAGAWRLTGVAIEHSCETPEGLVELLRDNGVFKKPLPNPLCPDDDHLCSSAIRARARTVCIAMQDMNLPALMTLEIIDALTPNVTRMKPKWDLVCAVKHFHDRKANQQQQH
jgi:hypothetical protein